MLRKRNSRSAEEPELLDISFFTGPSNRVLCRQRRSFAQLIVVTGGVYIANVDTERGRQRLRAETGDVVLWPAGSEDTDESESGRPLRCFSVEFHWSGMPSNLPFVVHDTDHVIDQLTQRLLDRAHAPARKGVMDWVAHAYLAAMLAEFLTLTEAENDTLPARVARYTEEHMCERIHRAALARHLGMDLHHFGRKYRELTGRTPMEDVRRRKAAYARQVLFRSPTSTLTQIAKLVGVRDTPALSRLLKQYAGVSAREIKRTAIRRYADNGR